MSVYTLDAAYAWCERLARSHYENFPVASRLLPRQLRRPVAVIYAFARSSDDLADEGDLPPAQRLQRLDAYGARLTALAAGSVPADDPIFVALADVVQRHRLPLPLFADLLAAFRQDVTTTRYENFTQVLDYCRRSANPVGRLLLHLTDSADAANLRDSDHICSALQLINFYQDLAQDIGENDRIYLPLDEMAASAVTVEHLRARRTDEGLRALLNQQYQRARRMMEQGAPLGRRLHGRFGLEIRLIVQGGLAVLDKLEQNLERGAAFARPRLQARDWLRLIWRAL